jgi:hypothetical protein
MPVAAGLFSTMIGWPSAFSRSGEMSRATMSFAPPAANGTIWRTGWVG